MGFRTHVQSCKRISRLWSCGELKLIASRSPNLRWEALMNNCFMHKSLRKWVEKWKKNFRNFLLNHLISFPKHFGMSREGLWSLLGPFDTIGGLSVKRLFWQPYDYNRAQHWSLLILHPMSTRIEIISCQQILKGLDLYKWVVTSRLWVKCASNYYMGGHRGDF